MSKVFKGDDERYDKIERLVLAVLKTARKIIMYFQGHHVVIKIDYPIHQVLKKLNLVGRMVS